MPMERKVRRLSIDMTGAEDRRQGSGGVKVPEGDYLLRINDAYVVPVKEGKNKGKDQVLWETIIEKPDSFKGGKIVHRTGVWPELMWTFRAFVEDLRGGKALPKRAADIDLEKFKGLLIGATLADGNPYGTNNTIKSEIKQTFPADQYEAAQAEEEDADDEDEDEAEIETSDDDDDTDVEEVDEEDV